MTVRRRLVVGLMVILVILIAAVGTVEVVVLRHDLYQRSTQDLVNELEGLSPAPPTPAATSPGLSPLGPSPTPPTPTPTPPTPTPPTPPTTFSTSTGSNTTGSCKGLGSAIPPSTPDTAGGSGTTSDQLIGPLGPAGPAGLIKSLAAKGIASAVAGPDGILQACGTATRIGRQTTFRVPASVFSQLSTGNGYVTVDSQGHHLLAIRELVGTDTVILATDLGDDDNAVRVVLTVIILSGLGALLAAALLSRPLLRSGLAPLRKISRTADAIADGDIDQRADLARSSDEIGHLGTAFDRMVDRLQSALIERDALVDQLRMQEQTVRRFVADASHELRTPLTAIRGSAQVLRLGAAFDPADLAESLNHIQTQTERMSRLVDDLLLLSRQDAGQSVSQKEPVDLAELIDGLRNQWQTLAGDHTLQISTESAWVTADPEALTRACTNLIENAAKYSPAGSPITLRVAKLSSGAELSVTDHGTGISATEKSKVFDRFYRGDPARARATGGAGLGLAIVASIISDHQGQVRIDDGPGGGTRISVNLPLAAYVPDDGSGS